MPNDTITLVISTLLGGGVLGAIINQFFARGKTRAEEKKFESEAEKNKAEAEYTKAETAKILKEQNPKASPTGESSPKELKGWFEAGSDPGYYEMGVDQKETYHGKPCGYIKSRESPRGFGTLMQGFKANMYLGKRLKMTGIAKSQGVEKWASLWMRVDGPDNKSLIPSLADHDR